MALTAADLLVVPEWVGLVVVDSIAAKVPIITTHHPSRSPEVEYLRHEQNSIFVLHGVSV